MNRFYISLSSIRNRTLILSMMFCGLLSTAAISQNSEIDSLKRLLEIRRGDTIKVKMLNELSYQYLGSDNANALQYANHALRLSKKLSYQKGTALAHNRLALTYSMLNDDTEAISHALEAVSIAEQGNLLGHLRESYRILGVAYDNQEEYEKAEQYDLKAERLAIQAKDWGLLTKVYNGAGITQLHKEKPDSALALFNKSLAIATKHRFHYFMPYILSNLGWMHRKNNLPRAIAYDLQALSLAKKIGNQAAEAIILNDLGKFYNKKKDSKEAEQYLNKALQLSERLGLKINKSKVYLNIAEFKILQNKFDEAQIYVDKYIELRDSLLNEKKARQIIEIETQYETEKKERAIELLEKEKQIQLLWKNILIGIGVLLIVLFGIAYWLLQLRNSKSRFLLAAQKALNAKLEETDQLKSQFFANISHEFRTPLTLILAPIEEKIRSPLTSASDKEDLTLVKRNASRLLNLVNQLLDLSKLRAGKLELQLKEGNIHEFLHVLAGSFNSLADSRQIQFSKNILAPTEPVAFDADKLEKIISNILFNAFKFTPSGGLVDLSAQVSIHGEMCIKVVDTGIGIPEKDQPHVFSPFYQAKNTFDDGRIGTGLGLSLVSELVKVYNGKITLVSEEGQGTTISVFIPQNMKAVKL